MEAVLHLEVRLVTVLMDLRTAVGEELKVVGGTKDKR